MATKKNKVAAAPVPPLDLKELSTWNLEEALADLVFEKLPKGFTNYAGVVDRQIREVDKLRQSLEREELKLRDMLAPYAELRAKIEAITITTPKVAATKPAQKKTTPAKPKSSTAAKKPGKTKPKPVAKKAALAAKSSKPAKSKPKSGAQKRREKAEREAAAAAKAGDPRQLARVGPYEEVTHFWDEVSCGQCGANKAQVAKAGDWWVWHPTEKETPCCSACLPALLAEPQAGPPHVNGAAIGSATPAAIAAHESFDPTQTVLPVDRALRPSVNGVVNHNDVPPAIANKKPRPRRSRSTQLAGV